MIAGVQIVWAVICHCAQIFLERMAVTLERPSTARATCDCDCDERNASTAISNPVTATVARPIAAATRAVNRFPAVRTAKTPKAGIAVRAAPNLLPYAGAPSNHTDAAKNNATHRPVRRRSCARSSSNAAAKISAPTTTPSTPSSMP